MPSPPEPKGRATGLDDLIKANSDASYWTGVKFGVLYALAFMGLPKEQAQFLEEESNVAGRNAD